jgi:DnaJ-domain-containing protein 1
MAEKTLYDVLRVRPDDDADTLQKAFRHAVKASHPDLHAGDPDAPSRFMRIVTAYAILRDDAQRGVYNQQLAIERAQRRARRRSKLTRTILDASMVVVFTAVMVGGYTLFEKMSKTPGQAAKVVEVAAREPAGSTVVQSTIRTKTANRDEPSARSVDLPATVPEPNAVTSEVKNGAAPAIADAGPANRDEPPARSADLPATVPEPGAVASEMKNGAPPAIADARPANPDEPSARSVEVPATVPEPSAVASEVKNGAAAAIADAGPANRDEPSARSVEVPATVPAPGAITSEVKNGAPPAIADARPADLHVVEPAVPTDPHDRGEPDHKLARAEPSDVPIVPRAVVKTTSKPRVHATRPAADRRSVRHVALASGNTLQVALEKRSTSACAGSCSDRAPPLFGVGF